jgi:hypothetical protein
MKGVNDESWAETRSKKCVRGKGVSTVVPGRKEASGGNLGAAADAGRVAMGAVTRIVTIGPVTRLVGGASKKGVSGACLS